MQPSYGNHRVMRVIWQRTRTNAASDRCNDLMIISHNYCFIFSDLAPPLGFVELLYCFCFTDMFPIESSPLWHAFPQNISFTVIKHHSMNFQTTKVESFLIAFILIIKSKVEKNGGKRKKYFKMFSILLRLCKHYLVIHSFDLKSSSYTTKLLQSCNKVKHDEKWKE